MYIKHIVLFCGVSIFFARATITTSEDSNNNIDDVSKPVKSTITNHNVTEIVSKEDLENRLKLAGNNLTVIMFYAGWCGYSRDMFPVFEELKNNFTDVVFLKVDIDKNNALSNQYNIRAMPTFVFIKNNTILFTIQGPSKEDLRKKIEEYTLQNNII